MPVGGFQDVHDDKIDKIYGRSFRESCIVVLLGYIIGHGAVLEPESVKRDTGSLKVPVRHSERGEGLENPDEAIRL